MTQQKLEKYLWGAATALLTWFCSSQPYSMKKAFEYIGKHWN